MLNSFPVVAGVVGTLLLAPSPLAPISTLAAAATAGGGAGGDLTATLSTTAASLGAAALNAAALLLLLLLLVLLLLLLLSGQGGKSKPPAPKGGGEGSSGLPLELAHGAPPPAPTPPSMMGLRCSLRAPSSAAENWAPWLVGGVEGSGCRRVRRPASLVPAVTEGKTGEVGGATSAAGMGGGAADKDEEADEEE